MKRPWRSISLPIVLASVAVTLSIALLVGWTLLIVRTEAFGLGDRIICCDHGDCADFCYFLGA